jgi:hypothetical protein
MDFNLIETFNNHNCGINFVPGDITTKECPQYSNESYQKLRNEYLEAILTKFLDLDSVEINKKCIIELIANNIKDSEEELDTMKSIEYDNKNSFESLTSNINFDELENNVLLSEKRIKETDELLYINNIKYYAIIVSLIIILIIELILIKL